MRRIPLALTTTALLILASHPAFGQDDGPTIVPNEQFCNLVADDIAACEQALETLGSAGMLPEAFAGLVEAPEPSATASDAAHGDSAVTPDGSGNAALGASLSRDDVRITVAEVDWDPSSSNSFFEPAPGNRYVSVLVRYEALEDGASYNPFYWSANDEDGFSYSYSIFSPREPNLSSGDLREGRKTQGWITFEVPQDVDWLEVQESQFFGEDLYWTVER